MQIHKNDQFNNWSLISKTLHFIVVKSSELKCPKFCLRLLYMRLICIQFYSTKVGNIWFLNHLVLSEWEDLAFSVCMLFEESVFIFQFLNNKMHNYVLFNTFVHFFIQKLKNKHTFLKTEKAKFSHFDRTRGDKKQIFPT